jgi:hypothetical protein
LIARKAGASAAVVESALPVVPEGDRLKARIADIIRNRGRESDAPITRAEPPVTAARHPLGPKPMIVGNARGTGAAPVIHVEIDDEDDGLYADMAMPEPELVAPEPIRLVAAQGYETGRMIAPEGSVVQR